MAASYCQTLLWSLTLVLAQAAVLVQGATDAEISALQDVASRINLPSNIWNFSTDPCSGSWWGICCCTANDSSCPVDSFTPDKSCSTLPNATVAGVVLDVNYQPSIPPLDGSISESICNLTSLVKLVLSNNPLHGEIPVCIGTSLLQLKYFQSVGGYLTGSIPQELGNLGKLNTLWLGYNMLSGAIPASLGNLQSLQMFSINGNQLSGAIPPELGRLTNLSTLHLQSNLLNGTIPVTLSNLSNLTELRLQANQLSGELNVSMFHSMPGLQKIHLHRNVFSGPVPALQLRSLSELNLGFNDLSGTIPESLGRLPSLMQLYLGHNNLSGSIPPTFTSLRNLKVLDISHNRLNGSLDSLASLPVVDFSFNAFDMQNTPPALASFGESFFNCILCLQTSVGKKQTSLGVVAGQTSEVHSGDVVFQPDSVLKQTGLSYFGSDRSWALEVSGELTDTYTAAPQSVLRIAAGENPALYQSMRWSSSYLAYHGRKLENGMYKVTLHFAETLLPNVTFRVFDVLVQGSVVKRKLDVTKEVGAFAAYRIQHNATVNDGTLSIELISNGADRYLDPKKYPVQREGPMVSAISIESFNKPAGSSKSWKKVILLSVLLPTTLVVSAVLMLGLIWRRRKTLVKSSEGGFKAYTYKELYKATDGFDEKVKLGQGAFGSVYLGNINGTWYAVKQLRVETPQAKQDFRKEMEMLSSVQHRNLLTLRGYCDDAEHPYMIVCDYMPNGSLNHRLYTGMLTWEQRKEIAIGSASGLAYLHDETKAKIVHCDIKPQNILLDHELHPRIGDFGMAQLHENGESHVTASRAGGTFGYLAREYAMHNHISDKVDVYSFGVVLLELVSGKQAIQPEAAPEEAVLVEWAHRLGEQGLQGLVDAKMVQRDGGECVEEAATMAFVGLHCTLDDPAARPSMRAVWLMLTGMVEVPPLPIRCGPVRAVESLMNLYLAEHLYATSSGASGASTIGSMDPCIAPR